MRPLQALVFAAAVLAAAPVTSLLAAEAAPPAAAGAGHCSEASVRELLALTNAKKLIEDMKGQMGQMIGPALDSMLKEMPEGLTDADRTQAREMAAKIFDSTMAEMTYEKFEPIYLKVYTETFTQEEVDGMIAFYKTPVGKSSLAKLPQVMQKSMVEMQPMLQEMMGGMQTKLQQFVADFTAKHQPQTAQPKAG